MLAFDITSITLMLSADKLCEQIGPRWCSKEHRAWSGSNLFDTQMVFLKKLIWKNQQTRNKTMKNCQGCKELTIYFIKILWPLWNIMYMKILWKLEHLLFWSKCSIFHNVFKSIKKLIFFSMWSKNRKMMSWFKNSQWRIELSSTRVHLWPCLFII